MVQGFASHFTSRVQVHFSVRHNWKATVGFKKILFPQQSLKSLVFNANTPPRAWAVLATCFLVLKVALWCIRTNWFNMCSPGLMCVKAVGKVVKLPRLMCNDFPTKRQEWWHYHLSVTVTLQLTLWFSLLCALWNSWTFHTFMVLETPATSKLYFISTNTWAGGAKVGQKGCSVSSRASKHTSFR